MLTDEVGHLAITRCFGLALVGDWRAAEQARRQSKPGREDDPPNRAAPEAPSRYFPVIPRSIAMGATGGTPMARAVLTRRSEEHTSELQSLMRISYAVFCLKKKNV